MFWHWIYHDKNRDNRTWKLARQHSWHSLHWHSPAGAYMHLRPRKIATDRKEYMNALVIARWLLKYKVLHYLAAEQVTIYSRGLVKMFEILDTSVPNPYLVWGSLNCKQVFQKLPHHPLPEKSPYIWLQEPPVISSKHPMKKKRHFWNKNYSKHQDMKVANGDTHFLPICARCLPVVAQSNSNLVPNPQVFVSRWAYL